MSAILAIVRIFILFQILNECWGNLDGDLFDQAKKITAANHNKYKNLIKVYNTSEDYTRLFNGEIAPPSTESLNANILLEYQYLIKNSGYCRRQTFQNCVNNYGKNIPNENKCPARQGVCDKNAKFAPIGGYCNNLKNPNAGKSGMAYIHLLKAVYSDDIRKIRTTVSGKELPSPRFIGNVLADPTFEDEYYEEHKTNNIMGLMFGQLLTHDSSNKGIYAIEGDRKPTPRCCNSLNSGPISSENINPNCIPVKIPKNDPFYSKVDVRCQNYIRLSRTFDNDCKISYAQKNLVSSFLDLSIIYSDEIKTLATLRTNSSGLLRTNSKNILPLNGSNYIAGDPRATQTPMLALFHSLFLRLHNVIAKNLAKFNPKWNDNELFFNSRRLNIAIYQSIVYNEWLPLFIDKEVWKQWKLTCGGRTKIKCDKYDISIDPSTSVEYANAAFRFYHKNIPEKFKMFDNNNRFVGELILSDYIFKNTTILQERYDDLLNGMLKQTMDYVSPMYNAELRNLFGKVLYRGAQVGIDLFLIDVMRSRDSGIAPFIDYIKFYSSKKIDDWNDLKHYFKVQEYKVLRKLYENVRDIDLHVGLLLEPHSKNRIGRIGSYIIADQYHRLRYGDRFFYSNPNRPNKFNDAQLKEIENTTFAKVLCLVSNSRTIPYHAFLPISKTNPLFTCDKTFNFKLFKA